MKVGFVAAIHKTNFHLNSFARLASQASRPARIAGQFCSYLLLFSSAVSLLTH
ncbi:hypothetical protein A2U01_0088061, partial [Trifolium medium]|nr:hypothetical protein [Trifolium medium]